VTAMHNLLTEASIRVVLTGDCRAALTLPGVFAALVRDEVISFPASRAHQRQAWHSFLVQLGTLALIGARESEPPEDEEGWRVVLRGLTPGHLYDEPWCLIAGSGGPALLPDQTERELKTIVVAPDALDMLVTAKNHDLKSEVMTAAAPDDWLFALITLQTMEGFLGAGNYGISRMNGGFASRPALGIAPPGGPGAHVMRDIGRLLALRDKIPGHSGFRAQGGLGLVWLEPWDGTQSLRPAELDPYYVEICRRVRLFEESGRLRARVGGSKVPRIAPFPGGVTGDPWAPIVRDKDGSEKVLTVDALGFGYRRMTRLLLGVNGISPSPLQLVTANDADEDLAVVARALVRGQGKTEGYHERHVRLSKRVGRLLKSRDTDPLARAAQERVIIAGEIQGRVLKPALYAIFENGPDQIDFRDNGAERRAGAFLKRFDAVVDRDFFPALWEEFEEQGGREARVTWVDGLLEEGLAMVREADQGMSKAVGRRYRAFARAEAVFFAAQRKSEVLKDYLPERSRDISS
jgi:CRISPR system Cascade subunit CasA